MISLTLGNNILLLLMNANFDQLRHITSNYHHHRKHHQVICSPLINKRYRTSVQ